LAGWVADEASSQAVNATVMGGGVNAEREYRKKSPSESGSLSVKFITDDPMLQGMIMMLSNPMFAASDGGKLEKIKDQKAIVKYQATNQSGSINIVVANRHR
jgi:hypothetical protein